MKRFLRVLKKALLWMLALILVLTLFIFLYMRLAKFGKSPDGNRQQLIEQSDNYRDGQFQNIHHTPTLTEGHSMGGILYKQLFKDHPRRKPEGPIPNVGTDLEKLPAGENVLVWFGHSSYYMQIDGMRFLVDPVFSGNASPVPGSVKAFEGANTYGVDDLPPIDYLFISHDHYDHLDYETILKLKDKVGAVICGLGVGSHFEHWGYPADKLIEKNWHETVELAEGFRVHTVPSRHFSGRTFKRNNTLWQAYVLETPSLKIYIGGDSGYDTHFAETGEKFGPVDLAILENGQYNEAWEAIHMLPPQLLKAATDLQAKRVFPVHNAKFVLAMHPWDQPMRHVTELNEAYGFPLVTPRIGEVVDLNDPDQTFDPWWEDVK
ncbi:MBL fold metallo-hydrolase [Roseivirga sp. BDSF3-8]|uniref:MBL fold metallo-hydrolase n=1 Tax=Roseivirga sp. BDSF3-8 TaxID=3241598 RepID=UPI0035326207